jgi:transcriptional regulator with XRE-family HTH domain
MQLMTPRDLATRARQLRKKIGIRQADVAEKTGLAESSVSKAENYRKGDGMTSARITIIEELARTEVEGPLYREM